MDWYVTKIERQERQKVSINQSIRERFFLSPPFLLSFLSAQRSIFITGLDILRFLSAEINHSVGGRRRCIISPAIDGQRIHSLEVLIPIVSADEQCTADDVADQRGDNAFPDVQSDRDVGATEEDGGGDEGHVRDHVVEPQRYEGEGGPPDADDFRGEFAAAHAEVAGETDEPVGADGSEEDHVPVWCDLFGFGEFEDFFFVGVELEDAAVVDQDSGHEKATREVAPEGYEPVEAGFGDAEAAVEDGDGGELNGYGC